MTMDSPRRDRVVAVIGGGFSGLLTAIHLLGRSDHVTVRLIERARRLGVGRAYAAADPDHLLNVRAANMSAFPDRPEHFAEWLAATGAEGGGDAFASRALYGDYLQALLREALGEGAAGRLLLEQDEAVGAAPIDGGFEVRLAMGRTIFADAIVLAVGSGPPRPAPGAVPELAASPAYAANPWSIEAAAFPNGDILLIGTGLTMVDAVLSLDRPGRRFLAVSRRGLAPHSHAPTVPTPPPTGPLDTPARALRTLRRLARATDWRSAVDAIRPVTPAIWRSWGLAERRRFLRHGRAWWDVHRHRMAPQIAARIAELRAAGRLEIVAARIERLEPAGDQVTAHLRRRGATAADTVSFAAAVNCTGLSGELGGSALLRDLAAQGLVRPDPLHLGLDVDEGFRAAPKLYAVGPLTRWARWETMAVPDLRRQTDEVAGFVLSDLGLPPA